MFISRARNNFRIVFGHDDRPNSILLGHGSFLVGQMYMMNYSFRGPNTQNVTNLFPKKQTAVPPQFTEILNIGYLRFLQLSHCKITSSLFGTLPLKWKCYSLTTAKKLLRKIRKYLLLSNTNTSSCCV